MDTSNRDRSAPGAAEAEPVADAMVPLTPAVFHILLALADGERHGYGIMGEVSRLTDGGQRLGPGTLYRSIKHLLSNRLIEESADRPDPALDDERRRYYRLTALGRSLLGAEARRLAALVRTAQDRGVLPRPASPKAWGAV